VNALWSSAKLNTKQVPRDQTRFRHHRLKILSIFSHLCFERRYPKQNNVARLKSNILPPKKLWAGYATVRHTPQARKIHDWRQSSEFVVKTFSACTTSLL